MAREVEYLKPEEILKEYILKKHKSIRGFSNESKIPYSTIDNVIRRGLGNAGVGTVMEICNRLEIDVESLYKYSQIVEKTPEVLTLTHPLDIRIGRKLTRLSEPDKLSVDGYVDGRLASEPEAIPAAKVPVFDEPSAAGLGSYLSDDGGYEMLSFLESEVPYHTDCGIRVQGDSMEPEIHDGDIVWVQYDMTINEGETGIFIYEGSAYCKRLLIDRDNQRVVLKSVNRERQDRDIIVYDEDNLRTVGRVLGRAR